MARTRTSSIKNMNAGEVADDTREIYRVTSDREVLAAVDAWSAWSAYKAEFDAWLISNSGLELSDFAPIWSDDNGGAEPPQFSAFAAVADRQAISGNEGLFVEVRFFEEHSDRSQRTAINARWCQMNSTNIQGLVPGDFAVFRKVFNARRTSLGLDPA